SDPSRWIDMRLRCQPRVSMRSTTCHAASMSRLYVAGPATGDHVTPRTSLATASSSARPLGSPTIRSSGIIIPALPAVEEGEMLSDARMDYRPILPIARCHDTAYSHHCRSVHDNIDLPQQISQRLPLPPRPLDFVGLGGDHI